MDDGTHRGRDAPNTPGLLALALVGCGGIASCDAAAFAPIRRGPRPQGAEVRAAPPVCPRSAERTERLIEHYARRCERGACEEEIDSCADYRAWRDRIRMEDAEYARANPGLLDCGPGPEAIPGWLRRAPWVGWDRVRFSPPLDVGEIGSAEDGPERSMGPGFVHPMELKRCDHGPCDCEIWFCLCGDGQLGTSIFLEQNSQRCDGGHLAGAIFQREVDVVGHPDAAGPVCVALGVDRRDPDPPGVGAGPADLRVVGIRRWPGRHIEVHGVGGRLLFGHGTRPGG